MRNVKRPNVNYQTLFQKCIDRKSAPLKANLQACFPLLSAAAQSYMGHAQQKTFFQIQKISNTSLSPVTDIDLITLYKNQMVKNPSPGRKTYDDLMISAKGRCPFCSHNYPRTLDHFLPKDLFPEFAVFPLNLVPCCRDCNSSKLNVFPAAEEDQYIHPYFDPIPNTRWLDCEVTFSPDNSPVLIFLISKTLPDDMIYLRMRKQFSDLNLGPLYSIQASNELVGIVHNLKRLFEAGGSDEVRSFLSNNEVSWSVANLNSWQAVMYHRLSQCDEFCQMNWVL